MTTRSVRTGEKTVSVLYLDIDGTVRWGKDELGHFVNNAADVRVYDEVPDLLQQYKELGWRIVGISNQGGIALGHMTMTQCVAAMQETNKQCGYTFDKIAWCSHHPLADTPEMAVCWCRKPKAGLIIETALNMAETFGEIYPPHMGLMVGDMQSDNEVAENAGLRFLSAEKWRQGVHLAEVAGNEES